MNILWVILIVAAIMVLLPAVFGIIGYRRWRAESANFTQYKICGRNSKKDLAPCYVLGPIFFLFVVAAFIGYYVDPDASVWLILFFGIVIGGIAAALFCGYFYLRFAYIAADEKGVTKYSAYGKKELIPYSELVHYHFIGRKRDLLRAYGGRGFLRVYDGRGILRIEFGDSYIGSKELLGEITAHGAKEISDYLKFPDEVIADIKPLKNWQKCKQLKINSWAFFMMSLLYFGMSLFMALLPMSPDRDFDGTMIEGAVVSIKRFYGRSAHVSIYIEGDEREFYVDSIVLDELDRALYAEVSAGDTITLIVDNFDEERNRVYLCAVKANGKTYLTIEGAARAHRENYNVGRVLVWVFLGVGVVCVAVSIVCFVKRRNYPAQETNA